MSFYLATFLAGLRLALPGMQWVALIAVTAATIATVAIWEDGRWPLGLFVPPWRAARESVAGIAFALCLIGGADIIIVATTGLHHEAGPGFPFRETLLVFIPAVVHEELLFRGYGFQKLWRRWRRSSIVVVSLIFAALHLGNYAVTVIGITNVFLGGVLLSLAYERHERLWFPIGLHFGWNIASGPILGFGVSGYAAEATVLRTAGSGRPWMTGGEFGIEGSLYMTITEIVAIVVLWRSGRRGMLNVQC